MKEKIGVLLMAYGSPSSLNDVEPYLTHIKGGRVSSSEQIEDLKKRYQLIGGSSPLLDITKKQALGLQARLNKGKETFSVYVGMKHSPPFIEEAVLQMSKDGVKNGVAIALAPHFSKMSIGGYIKAVEEAPKNVGGKINLTFVNCWNKHPLFILAVVEKIKNALRDFNTLKSEITVIFTAHSLPEKILESNDPYPQQLLESCQLVVNTLELKEWHLAYQSASQTGEKWLGPDVKELIPELHQKGKRKILVVPIGFVSDHLEVLYDIDVECKKLAESLGIMLHRTESLNTSPLLIETLHSLVCEKLQESCLDNL